MFGVDFKSALARDPTFSCRTFFIDLQEKARQVPRRQKFSNNLQTHPYLKAIGGATQQQKITLIPFLET